MTTEIEELNYQWIEVPKMFVDLVEDLETAAFLHYALRETTRIEVVEGSGAYFYQPPDYWYRLLKLTPDRLETIIQKLKQAGLIRIEVRNIEGSLVRHIRAELEEAMRQVDEMEGKQ